MSILLAVSTGIMTSCRLVNSGNVRATEGPIEWKILDGWPVTAGITQAMEKPAVNVQMADNGWFLADDAGEPASVNTTTDGCIEIRYEEKGGVLTELVEPWPQQQPRGVRRRLSFTNTGPETIDIVNTSFSVGAISEHVLWEPPWFRMVGAADAPHFLCVANWGDTDFHAFEGNGPSLRSVFRSAWRLAPGQTAEVGWQCLWVGNGQAQDAYRAEARRFYREHGFEKPLAYPSWLTEGALYEASAAGHIDSRFSDTGGFDSFARQVPYLADLGITSLWLNAVQGHKTPPDPVNGGWNHYDPRDFLNIDPILGGAAGFTRLGRSLEENSIHLLSEIVPHGGHSAQGNALPEWHTRERDGKLRGNWGGCGMDDASPAWQSVLRESMELMAQHAKVEGLRIDVADGQGPNWGSSLTNHASRSGIIASRDMLQAVADGIRTGNGTARPLLIPETAARPEYFAIPGTITLGYGFETTHFLQELSTAILSDAPVLNRALRKHFERHRGSLPPGALSVQSLNNHDTVCSVGRAMYRFGVGLHRALYAVCVAVPGIPMMYQEEELGSFYALRELNLVRRRLPWLAAADVVYPETDWIDPRVFSAWRLDGDNAALCLINLSGVTIEAPIAWIPPTGARHPGWLLNAATEQAVALSRQGAGSVLLEPYGCAFLTPGSGRAPAPAIPAGPMVAPAEPPSLTALVADGSVRVTNGRLTLTLHLPDALWTRQSTEPGVEEIVSDTGRVRVQDRGSDIMIEGELKAGAATPAIGVTGAREWAIAGRTGLLRDRVLYRHQPFPEAMDYRWERTHCWGVLPWSLYGGKAPVGRLWQSLLEPLHPDHPAFGFTDETGAGLLVHSVDSNAMNLVLTDGSDETVPISDELEMRFLAIDADLHPAVQQAGIRPFWTIQKPDPVPPRALHFAVTISACADVPQALAARPLPFKPGGPVEQRFGERFPEMGGRVFLIEPGRIEWTNLPSVKGRFVLEFELRSSETSGEDTDLAGAYRITLNDQPLALDWVRMNVWSTGNAYFAKAQSPPVDLSDGPHELTIQTTHTWCALLPQATLIPAPE